MVLLVLSVLMIWTFGPLDIFSATIFVEVSSQIEDCKKNKKVQSVVLLVLVVWTFGLLGHFCR